LNQVCVLVSGFSESDDGWRWKQDMKCAFRFLGFENVWLWTVVGDDDVDGCGWMIEILLKLKVEVSFDELFFFISDEEKWDWNLKNEKLIYFAMCLVTNN
jgi:hypothetical protein